jgi:hypothetical protein
VRSEPRETVVRATLLVAYFCLFLVGVKPVPELVQRREVQRIEDYPTFVVWI